MSVTAICLTTLSSLASVPGLVFGVQCLLGTSPSHNPADTHSRNERGSPARPNALIVIPAHNEEAGITATILNIRSTLSPTDRILVIADNCSDNTGAVASAAGAEVLIRHDKERRGKGYAIHFAMESLASEACDHHGSAVIIIDADCFVSDRAVDILACRAVEEGRPIQADYLLHSPPGTETVGTKISAFALMVRNRIRPRGAARLGIPAQLTGSGMAFPFSVLQNAPSMAGNIVEDLALGLELALLGQPARYCGAAQVRSELPVTAAASETQRSRWESGHLSTLLKQAPRLLGLGLVRARWNLFSLGLDLAVPPLSLLVFAQTTLLALTLGYGIVSGIYLPALISLLGLSAVTLGVTASWLSEGYKVLPPRQLLSLPAYVFLKLPRLLRALYRGADKTWVRTTRGVDP